MVALRRIALALLCSLGLWVWLAATLAEPSQSDDKPAEFNHAEFDDRLIAIPVDRGTASFDIPAAGDHGQFLIIASALSTQPGPFPIEIRTEPTANPRPLALLDTHPSREFLEHVRRERELVRRSRRDFSDSSIRQTSGTAAASRLESPAERNFYVMVRGDDISKLANYEAVRARRAAVGRHVVIYVDPHDATEVADETIRELIDTFDDAVFPVAERQLGSRRDVDGDGRFAILLTHWLGKLCGGTVSVGGFVRGSDFYSDEPAPISNHCDLMYLNSNVRPGPHLRTLIAHEYTHAVTFSQRVFGGTPPGRSPQEEESWLDEAIAHQLETVHGYSWSNLDYRISGFLNAPERYRLVVEDYFAADLWRGHGNRGATYLFLRWCVDQFGESLLRDLVQSYLVGVQNVEVATGRPFAELYRDWSVAVALDATGCDTQPTEQFRGVRLRGVVGDRLVGGARFDELDLAGDSRGFTLVGTSTKYLVAHSPPGDGPTGTHVRITAPADAKLQVSVRRLPDSLARLRLTAARTDRSASSDAKEPRDGGASFRLELTEQRGVGVTLEHAAWERTAPGSNHEGERGCSSRILDADDLASLFGTTRLDVGGRLVASKFVVAPLAAADRSVVLKVTGRDDAGHAVTAWCTLPVGDAELPAISLKP